MRLSSQTQPLTTNFLIDVIGFIDKVGTVTEELVGNVMLFFAKPCVAAIEITSGTLSVGDTIRIKGTTTDFEQKIESMEIDRKPVPNATVGQSVGIKVKDRVRPHDKVFRLAV